MMDTMAPPLRPTVQRPRRITLPAGPTAAAAARGHVRAAIDAWRIPVDVDIAVLLTSELVTNALTHDAGGTVRLAISCAYGQLHVDVHDTSPAMPVAVEPLAVDAEAGRGLMLVASLATTWGFYPTPSGKAVYFTLAFQSGPNGTTQASPQGERSYAW